METILEQKLNIDKSTWQKVKFGDVVKEPKESIKDPVSSGVEHVIGLEHIIPEEIHLRKWNTLEDGKTFTKAFKTGDVLFGRRRAYLKKAAQASFNGICSGDITVFRVKEDLLPELLPFIVNNDKFFDYAVKHSAGGLSPRVKFKDLANYEFLLPPKDQQAQLAELLWAMDEVIERDTHTLAGLRIQRQAEEKNEFSHTLNAKLRDVVTKTLSGGTPNTKKSVYYKNGTIPWITSKILSGDRIALGEKKISRQAVAESAAKILIKGNIVAGTRVGVGKFSINDVDISFSQDITGLEVNNEFVDVEFLIHQLNSFLFQSRIKPFLRGTTIKGITKDDLLALKIYLPELEEQHRIKMEIQTVKESIQNIMIKIESSKSLQKSLIHQIF